MLVIAGLDPSGGAGIAVDCRVMSSYGLAPLPAVSALAIQSHCRGIRVVPMDPADFRAELEAALENSPAAAKIGMMAEAELIEVAAELLSGADFPIILDPVLSTSSGMELLTAEGRRELLKSLLPAAGLITPNWPEAGALFGETPEDIDSAEGIAARVYDEFGTAVLLKGGHAPGRPVDILADNAGTLRIPGERVEGDFRGTGCALSSMIAAEMALGKSLRRAVLAARENLAASLANSTPPYLEVEKC